MPDMLFILMLALVILGPKKLPQVARQLGKYLAQFRSMKSDVMSQIEDEMRKLETDTSAPPGAPSSASRQNTHTGTHSNEFREILKLITSGASTPGQGHGV